MSEVLVSDRDPLLSVNDPDSVDAGGPVLDEESAMAGSGSPAAWFNFVKSMLGAGLLAVPRAFGHAGIVAGTLIYIAVGAATATSMVFIVLSKREARRRGHANIVTYRDVAGIAYGVWGARVVQFHVVFLEWCFCAGFFVVMLENLEGIFPSVARWVFLAVLGPLLTGLCFVRFLKDLVCTSILGVLVCVVPRGCRRMRGVCVRDGACRCRQVCRWRHWRDDLRRVGADRTRRADSIVRAHAAFSTHAWCCCAAAAAAVAVVAAAAAAAAVAVAAVVAAVCVCVCVCVCALLTARTPGAVVLMLMLLLLLPLCVFLCVHYPRPLSSHIHHLVACLVA